MKSPLRLLASFLLLPVAASLVAAEPVKLTPAAIADGEISFLADGSTIDFIKDTALTAKAGKLYGTLYTTVIEIELAGKVSGPVKSAILELACNSPGDGINSAPSPVTLEIYGYFGSSADGLVDKADAKAGQLLGVLVTKGQDVGKHGQLPPFDATAFINDALSLGKPIVGFRLQAKDVAGNQKVEGLSIRTSEFGVDYPGYEPTLKIISR